MKRNFNNPTNFRVGQSGPKGRKLVEAHYPLDDREQELEGEINSPTIPAVYKRMHTIDYETAPQRGSVGESSHEAYKHEKEYSPGVSQETWDNPEPMTEENVRMKYVKLGVESEDESYKGDNQPKYY